MTYLPSTFTSTILSHWAKLGSPDHQSRVSGFELDIADVVKVAHNLTKVSLTPEAKSAIHKCSDIIVQKINDGEVIYGVNTGFGGSADTRTEDVDSLQQSLFHLLMAGITTSHGPSKQDAGKQGVMATNCQSYTPDTIMPETWVRAAMIVRLNSLSAGASGIRECIAENLAELLNNDIVPVVPLRGSISASGDLQPLAYVGAVMQGKSYVAAYCAPNPQTTSRIAMRADLALKACHVEPTTIRAKEGLAIVNGTAFSAGVAALACHDCLGLAALSQVLTAMTVEAIRGTDESFDPFIARVRAHPGQIDSARCIRSFLAGSKLIMSADASDPTILRQDRYSVRTASQWIGPVLEDMQLAQSQITIELNSVTDNPLIDAAGNRIVHGGNFQAKAITSAAEKLRQGLQSLGRMLFSQMTELINPVTNNGLPPNLVADHPSRSFLFKGSDIMAAALTSELGFLANPVGTHVQTAEMGNQGINSLALISVRYTLQAVDVMCQLVAAHLVALCQAFDLRSRELLSVEPGSLHVDVARTMTLLGPASCKLYRFVRQDLKVPFLSESVFNGQPECDGSVGLSVGACNTIVYEALKSGRLYEVVMECFREAKPLC